MELIFGPETSVGLNNCQFTLRNILEERRSYLHPGRSLKSHIKLTICRNLHVLGKMEAGR
jgi:hypothetical protein